MAKLKNLIQGGAFAVGDSCLVGTTQELGTIKFIGSAQFSPGEWVGVELEKPLGKNDGLVKDVKYFDCKPKHGIFVRKTNLLRPKQAEEVVQGSKEKEPKKTKGAKALMSGLKSGEVGKIVDKMEDESVPVSSNATNKENGESNSTQSASPKTSKPETPSRSASRSRSSKPAGELDEQAAAAVKDLRQAAEEHNPDALRRALLVAENKGVSAEELGSANRILAFERERILCQEIDKLRNVVNGLVEVVRQTQEKAKVAEESAKNTNAGNWVSNLVKRIEGRVWEGLEKKIEERIESTVCAVAREMVSTFSKSPVSVSGTQDKDARSAAAKKIQMAWRRKIARLSVDADTRCFNMIVRAARKRHEAWSGIFDEICAKKKAVALGLEDFHMAITEVHPRLAQGQTNILFKGFAAGTGRCDVDLLGFVGICEAVAVGDQTAAEFADVNVETFQNLAKAGGDEAALKIQCLQRQRAARAQAKQKNVEATTSAGSFETATGREGSQPVKARKWRYSEEQAAVMIQRWMRRRLAGIKEDPLAMAVKRVKLRYAAWCSAYDEVCNKGSGLDESSFEKAMERAIPCRLSTAQKRVLYQGCIDGARQDSIDMVGFCAIASAVAAGDETAAEYADMNLYMFQALGEKECG